MIFSKNSGAEPMPKNPLIWLLKYLNWLSEIHDPILDPIKIKSFFFIILFIIVFVSKVHLVIFPFVNSPDDFPWPEYSIAKKPILFLLANDWKDFGFFPSISDIKPGKKTI